MINLLTQADAKVDELDRGEVADENGVLKAESIRQRKSVDLVSATIIGNVVGENIPAPFHDITAW